MASGSPPTEASKSTYKLWIEECGEWSLETVARDLTAKELIEIWIERNGGEAISPKDFNVFFYDMQHPRGENPPVL